MAIVEAKVDMKNLKEINLLLQKLLELIRQIEVNSFKDSLGHELKTNSAYVDLKEIAFNLKNNRS